MKFYTRYFVFAGFAVLVASAAHANGDDGSWTGFLGRFHPVVLHFPIGLIIGLVLLEITSLFTSDPRTGDSGRWIMLGLGAVSAVLASVFGWFLAWEASYDEHLLFEHRWTGVGVSVTAVLAAAARLVFNRHEDHRMLWLYRLMVLLSAGLLMPAGHHGGQLTHGTEFLAEDIPASIAFLAPMLGGEHNEENAVEIGDNYFASEILPILEAKCFECHSAEKQKGELRMDTLDAILGTGESGRACVVPGNISESYMIELMLLPAEHEDVMPPSGKPQLEPEEILQLARWVSRGAPWGDYTPPEPSESSADEVEVAETLEGGVVPLVTAYEVMELFFEDPPEIISAALAEEPADRKARRAIVKTVFSEVNRLAEAHNLLFSRTDEEYMLTPEWETLTIEGRDAAVAMTDYLKDRDWEYAELRSRYEAFIHTCNRCHDYFETGEDPIVAWPDLEADEAAEE